jgi:large subunit ribosomal protein L15
MALTTSMFDAYQIPPHSQHFTQADNGAQQLITLSLRFSIELTPLNLDTLQHWLSTSRLPPSSPTNPLTMRELLASRALHGIKDGVKLLARNRTATPLTHPIHITVSRASASAIKAIEDAGGSVTTRYYTKAAINRVLKGETHPTLSLLSLGGPTGNSTSPTTSSTAGAPSSLQNPHTVASQSSLTSTPPDVRASLLAEMQAYPYRLPDPTGRKDLEYYRDPKHRGYLSWQLRQGQGPSLFFKTPGEVALGREGAKRRMGKKKEGRASESLW